MILLAFVAAYRHARRDQAPHHPTAMRMSRRTALTVAYHQARGA